MMTFSATSLAWFLRQKSLSRERSSRPSYPLLATRY